MGQPRRVDSEDKVKILKRQKFILCGEEWELQIVDDLEDKNACGQWWSEKKIIQVAERVQCDDTVYHELVEVVCQMLCYAWEPRNANNHELMLHVLTHPQQTNVSREVWGCLIQLFPSLKKGIK